MNPELLTESVNANVLLLSMSETMRFSRERIDKFSILQSGPNRISKATMATVGQVIGLFCVPSFLGLLRSSRDMENTFRNIDIASYSDEVADKFCDYLREYIDKNEEYLRMYQSMYLPSVLCLRWYLRRSERAIEAMEDLLEVWLLMRNTEFVDVLNSVVDEMGDYSEQKAMEASSWKE